MAWYPGVSNRNVLRAFEARANGISIQLRTPGGTQLALNWGHVANLSVLNLKSDTKQEHETKREYVFTLRDGAQLDPTLESIRDGSSISLFITSGNYGLDFWVHLVGTGGLFLLGAGSFKYKIIKRPEYIEYELGKALLGTGRSEEVGSGVCQNPVGNGQLIDMINKVGCNELQILPPN